MKKKMNMQQEITKMLYENKDIEKKRANYKEKNETYRKIRRIVEDYKSYNAIIYKIALPFEMLKSMLKKLEHNVNGTLRSMNLFTVVLEQWLADTKSSI